MHVGFWTSRCVSVCVHACMHACACMVTAVMLLCYVMLGRVIDWAQSLFLKEVEYRHIVLTLPSFQWFISWREAATFRNMWCTLLLQRQSSCHSPGLLHCTEAGCCVSDGEGALPLQPQPQWPSASTVSRRSLPCSCPCAGHSQAMGDWVWGQETVYHHVQCA